VRNHINKLFNNTNAYTPYKTHHFFSFSQFSRHRKVNTGPLSNFIQGRKRENQSKKFIFINTTKHKKKTRTRRKERGAAGYHCQDTASTIGIQSICQERHKRFLN